MNLADIITTLQALTADVQAFQDALDARDAAYAHIAAAKTVSTIAWMDAIALALSADKLVKRLSPVREELYSVSPEDDYGIGYTPVLIPSDGEMDEICDFRERGRNVR